jgi:hypothetical protein
MGGAQPGHLGKLGQPDRVAEMSFDVIEHTPKAVWRQTALARFSRYRGGITAYQMDSQGGAQ